MDITLYARAIDDVSAVNHDTIAVSLSDVDVSQVVLEVGSYELLGSISKEEIKEYLEELDSGEEDDN